MGYRQTFKPAYMAGFEAAGGHLLPTTAYRVVGRLPAASRRVTLHVDRFPARPRGRFQALWRGAWAAAAGPDTIARLREARIHDVESLDGVAWSGCLGSRPTWSGTTWSWRGRPWN